MCTKTTFCLDIVLGLEIASYVVLEIWTWLKLFSLANHCMQVWQMRTGPRLLTIQCAKGSKLLQPTYRFGSSLDSPYVPLEVFLLNGDSGQLSVLNRSLNWICKSFSFFSFVPFYLLYDNWDNFFCILLFSSEYMYIIN